MKKRTVINDGKRRIIITARASGVDKVKDAVLVVMGPGWEYEKIEGDNDENK